MRRLFSALFAGCLAFVAADVAHGFNALGHWVIGKVAYDKLTPAQRATIHEIDFNAWGAEGYKLAAKYCYLDGMLPLSPWQPGYDQGGDAAADVPTLSATAQENARKIYRQRLLLAGERLARQLDAMFP